MENERKEDLLKSIIKYSNLTSHQLGFKLGEGDNEYKTILDSYVKGESNWFFTGKVGTGKTYLAISMLNTMMTKYLKCGLYYTVPRFLMTARHEMAGGREFEFIEKLTNIPYLLLDDLCVQRISDYSSEMLYIILDDWINKNKKGLIITSNLSLSEIDKKIGERLSSRIAGMCEIKKFTGKDKRLK